MSDATPDPVPTPGAADPAPPTPEKPAAARPRRSFRHRLFIVFIVALIALGILRIVVTLALPVVIHKAAGFYGFDCTYERADLSMLGGDLNLWNLVITPKDGGDPLLATDYIQGNIAVLPLLIGKLHVWRAEADGVSMTVDRLADGSSPLIDRVLAAVSSGSPAKTSGSGKPVDLRSPLTVDAFRLHHLSARLRDYAISPTVDTKLLLDVRVSDLGSVAKPTEFEIDAGVDGILDSFRVTGRRKVDPNSLDANFIVTARGLRLKPAMGYLQPLGLRPVADSLSMEVHGNLTLAPVTQPQQAGAIAGKLVLSDLKASADGQEAFAMHEMSLDLHSISSQGAELGKLAVDGVRANAGRGAGGALHAAGIDLVSAPPTTRPAATVASSTSSTTAAPAFPVTLNSFAASNVKLSLEDLAVKPATQVAILVDRISADNLAGDPSKVDALVNLTGKMHVPGIAKDVWLNGGVRPFAKKKTADLDVHATGIRPDALRPYLDALGIESLYQDGRFECKVSASATLEDAGKLAADAKISGVKLSDGADLFTLDSVNIAGFVADPAKSLVRAESIEVSGPGTSFGREASGSLAGLGLRFKVPKPLETVATAPPSTGGAPAAVPHLPAIEIGKFAWKNIRLRLRDQTAAPPADVTLSDAGVEISDLRLDLNGSQSPAGPGKIHAWASIPDAAKELSIEGTALPQPGGVALDLHVKGEGLRGSFIAPYLKPLGIEPLMKDGSLAVQTRVDVAMKDDGLAASLNVSDLRFADGSQELAALGGFKIDDVHLKARSLSVSSIDVNGGKLHASRESDGSLFVAGVRVSPVLWTASAPPATQPAQAATTRPATGPAAPGEPPFAVTLGKLKVADTSLVWSDHAVHPAVETAATANLDLQNLVLGAPADPATINLAAKVDGSLDEFALAGTFSLAPQNQSAKLEMHARGIQGGPLAAYFPPGIAATLKDGRFKTRIDAAMSVNPHGGYAGRLAIDGVDYRDGPDGSPLFALDSVKLAASRVDLRHDVIALDEVSVGGVETNGELAAGGIVRLLGLALSSPPADAAPATRPAAPAVAEPATQPAPDAMQLVASARKPLPTITLEKFDLALKRATFTDTSRPDSAAVSVANVRLVNVGRIELGGADAATRLPTQFDLTGKIDPLIETFHIKASLAPFAQQPTIQARIDADGIHGPGLTAVVPELKQHLDASGLEAGSFTGQLEATLSLDRRVAGDFDLSQGFDLDFLLHDVEFHAEPRKPEITGVKEAQTQSEPGKPTYTGVKEVRTESARYRAATHSLIVKSLEITDPVASAFREKDGIHALGLVLKLPQAGAPATQPASTEPAATQPAAAPPATVVAASTRPAEPPFEVRIDRLLVSGLNGRIEDRTTKPPIIIPLTGLDADVRGLSNRMLYEDRACRFTVLVNAGTILLPKNPKSAGVPGAIGGFADLLGGKNVPTTRESEDRELFSQAVASGKVALYPHPTGWMKTSISGLELMGLSGAAQEAGISVGGGTFDGTVDLRLPGDGTIKADTRLVATDLRVKEPPNGPISRHLNLPAPLDAVLGVIQDADGSITIPASVTLKDSQIDGIGGAAATAIGSVMITAFGSAPVKAIAGVGALLGLSGDKKPLIEPPVVVTFAAGYTALEGADRAKLYALSDRLRKDPTLVVTLTHELGGGDVPAVKARANPSPEDAAALAAQLHARKVELSDRRTQAAAEARTRLAAGLDDAPAAIDRLRSIDRDAAQTEEALDRVYDLLRPGADRQNVRRTRQASIELSRDRLQVLRESLLSSGIPNASQRIRAVNPTFNPSGANAGGSITLALIHKKKE